MISNLVTKARIYKNELINPSCTEKRVGADLGFHSVNLCPFHEGCDATCYMMEEKTKGWASSQVVVQEL